MSKVPEDVVTRLMRKVQKTETCWIWVGAINRATGYGHTKVAGKWAYVHRVMYQLLVGEIPAGFYIDHLCRNTACCNPAHLEAVTPRENVRRGKLGVLRPPRPLSAVCPAGHLMEGDNLRISSSGRRVCRKCSLESSRRYKQANPEKVRATHRASNAKYRAKNKAKTGGEQ